MIASLIKGCFAIKFGFLLQLKAAILSASTQLDSHFAVAAAATLAAVAAAAALGGRVGDESQFRLAARASTLRQLPQQEPGPKQHLQRHLERHQPWPWPWQWQGQQP
jgi:hypothetical protein